MPPGSLTHHPTAAAHPSHTTFFLLWNLLVIFVAVGFEIGEVATRRRHRHLTLELAGHVALPTVAGDT